MPFGCEVERNRTTKPMAIRQTVDSCYRHLKCQYSEEAESTTMKHAKLSIGNGESGKYKAVSKPGTLVVGVERSTPSSRFWL